MITDYTSLLVIDSKATLNEKKSVNDYPNEIIQLDIAVIDTVKNQIIEDEVIFVKPIKNKINDACEKYFGIKQSLIDSKGVSFTDLYRRLRIHYMLKDRRVISWAKYDLYTFNTQCKMLDLERMVNAEPIIISDLFATMTGAFADLSEALKYSEISGTANQAYDVASLYCRMARGLRIQNKQRIVQPAHLSNIN